MIRIPELERSPGISGEQKFDQGLFDGNITSTQQQAFSSPP